MKNSRLRKHNGKHPQNDYPIFIKYRYKPLSVRNLHRLATFTAVMGWKIRYLSQTPNHLERLIRNLNSSLRSLMQRRCYSNRCYSYIAQTLHFLQILVRNRNRLLVRTSLRNVIGKFAISLRISAQRRHRQAEPKDFMTFTVREYF